MEDKVNRKGNMETLNFKIIDFDGFESDSLGTFFYNERILFGWEKDFGVRSYRFKLKLTTEEVWLKDRDLNGIYSPFEKLEFIHTCDLKDFVKEEIFEPGTAKHDMYDGEEGIPYVHKIFNYEKLIQEADPKQYQFVKERLFIKVCPDHISVPEPVIFTGHWGEGSEFLEVDEFTSFAGNFKQDDKEGCCMDFGPTEKIKDPFDWTIKTGWTKYDLPREIQLENYKWSDQQKIDFFNKLSLKDKHTTAFSAVKRFLDLDREWRGYFPYRIYLYGTDDTSYSKWFFTEEEMMKEVNWLRKMQPLNLIRDLLDREFMFTN